MEYDEATFRYTVHNIRNLKGIVLLPTCYVRNLPWKILLKLDQNKQNQKCFGLFLQCNGKNKSSSWSCNAKAELRLISHKSNTTPFSREIEHNFNSKENDWGFLNFMLWSKVMDPQQGYLKDDSVTVEVYVCAEEPLGVSRVSTENDETVNTDAETTVDDKTEKKGNVEIATGADVKNQEMVPCPNKLAGCVSTMLDADVQDHLEECLFRDAECPLGLVSGKCSWQGKVNDIMDHFKQRHADNCDVSFDADVVLEDIDIEEDERLFFLVSQDKMLFILTFRLDTLQEMAYWTVQYIGSKVVAKQHIYEIHMTSNQDQMRKFVYNEYCINDAIKADEVFRQGKCAIFPLKYLSHFIKDKKLTFRFFIKRLSGTESPKQED